MKLGKLAMSAALTAGSAYFFDPAKGRKRRAWAKEKVIAALRKVTDQEAPAATPRKHHTSHS